MLRRNSTTALLKAQVNLGPPLRAIDFNLNGYESEEEGIRDALISVGDQRAKTPAITKVKPTECKESENKENKVGSFTPFTKPNPSAGYGKNTSDSIRGTPSSTFPCFLGNTAQNTKETRRRREGLTPSSTLPSSFPPPETGATYRHDECPTVPQPLQVCSSHVSISANHPRTPTMPPSMGRVPETWGTKVQNEFSLPLQNGSISKQLRPSALPSHAVAAQNLMTSKPPLDHSAAKRQERGQQQRSVHEQCEKPLSLSPEEKDTDVVMRSSHEEKRFKKLKLLGVGGSSRVYKVVGEDYQVYALKEVYIRHVDPAIKTAYINEIKLLNRLRDKPEIITLHDYTWNKREGVLYLLLEYAETDFNTVIKKRSGHAHPMATALYFWNEMLQIVKVIHDEGVIHNDLKPENFVVIGAQLKLIDFGIANRIEEEKTSIHRDIRCGTINYMAPETIETYEDKEFFKVGRPSDVWSLGCILYLMVYRKTPFEHIKNKMMKWHAISNPSTPIPFPEISNKAAMDVMQKCLRRNPKERPTIDELIAHPFSCLQEMPP